MHKFKVGLVIGRFQPFHLGHKYLIEQALHHADKIIIGIGSSNISDQSNPYSLTTREKFLREFINQEHLETKVIKIVPIIDTPDDEDWYKIALEATGPVDAVIGDNDWVNTIYRKHNIPVIEIGHLDRSILQGMKIRQNMKRNISWEERVPHYLVPHIKKG